MSGRHSWGCELTRIESVKQALEITWTNLRSEMRKMTPFAEVRPANGFFKYTQDKTAVRVDVAPVSFRLKEKPQADKAKLFVTVAGYMVFESAGEDSFRIIRFATRVGYFLEKTETLLKHVYGVHYDYDDKNVAHPVFHSQMAPMTGFMERINADYHRKFSETEDCVGQLLANVRIPTAQMDAFAVFLQLFSDHFVSSSSDSAAKAAYKKSGELCGRFHGACPDVPRLKNAIVRQSFRPQHWYG